MNLATDNHRCCANWIIEQMHLGRGAVFCNLVDGDIVKRGQLFTMPMTPSVELRMEYQRDEFIGVYDRTATPDDILSDLVGFWYELQANRPRQLDIPLAEEMSVAGNTTALQFAQERMHIEYAMHHLFYRFYDATQSVEMLKDEFRIKQDIAYRRVEEAQNILAMRSR